MACVPSVETTSVEFYQFTGLRPLKDWLAKGPLPTHIASPILSNTSASCKLPTGRSWARCKTFYQDDMIEPECQTINILLCIHREMEQAPYFAQGENGTSLRSVSLLVSSPSSKMHPECIKTKPLLRPSASHDIHLVVQAVAAMLRFHIRSQNALACRLSEHCP